MAKKEFYVVINGEKIFVTEEVYRAYVRPVRNEQRNENRRSRCMVGGKDAWKTVQNAAISGPESPLV